MLIAKSKLIIYLIKPTYKNIYFAVIIDFICVSLQWLSILFVFSRGQSAIRLVYICFVEDNVYSNIPLKYLTQSHVSKLFTLILSCIYMYLHIYFDFSPSYFFTPPPPPIFNFLNTKNVNFLVQKRIHYKNNPNSCASNTLISLATDHNIKMIIIAMTQEYVIKLKTIHSANKSHFARPLSRCRAAWICSRRTYGWDLFLLFIFYFGFFLVSININSFKYKVSQCGRQWFGRRFVN